MATALKLVDDLPAGPTRPQAAATADVTTAAATTVTANQDPDQPKAALIPLSEILAIGKDNVREEYDEEELEGLAQSIRLNGQASTIVLEPLPDAATRTDGKKYCLRAGYRRYFAAERASIPALFAVIRTFADAESADALNMAENLEREDVSLYSYCRKIRGLLDKGWTTERIIRQCGFQDKMGRTLISFVKSLAPELVTKLKYDESVKMIHRLEWIIRNVKGNDRQDTFQKQIECWNTEGWKSKEPRGKRREKPAEPDQILAMANRIRIARGLAGAEGEWIAMTQDQADAVCLALAWCATPRSRRPPL